MNTRQQLKSITSNLNDAFYKVFENAIFIHLKKIEGEFPNPDTFDNCARIVNVTQGMESWAEFQWKDKSIFKICLKFTEKKVTIEIIDL
jgi:hypothetical protein